MGIVHMIWRWLKVNKTIILIVLLVAVIGNIAATHWYQYQLNPDAISYFTIAQKYASGDFWHAINSYWGPLLSWLLVPAVWLNINLVVAAKVISIFAVIITMLTAYIFLRRQAVGIAVANIVAVLIAVLILPIVLGLNSGDFLMALAVVLFAISSISLVQSNRPVHAIATGATGAMMYYSKGIGFYLFLAVIFLCWLVIDTHSKKESLRKYLIAIGAFLVLTLPFIIVASIKYNHPTVNSSGPYNLYLNSPLSDGTFHPWIKYGPNPPPNNSAISAWEDPAYLIPIIPGNDWSPLNSKSDILNYFSRIFGPNLIKIREMVNHFGVAVIFGCLLMVVGSFGKRDRQVYQIFFFICLLLVAAYSIITVEPRFLLGPATLAIMAAGLWIGEIQKVKLFSRLQVLMAALIICGISILGASQPIIESRGAGKLHYKQAQSLKNIIPPRANVISNRLDTIDTCYWLGLRCYGVFIVPEVDSQAYHSRLKELEVNYLIIYHISGPLNIAEQNFIDKYYRLIDSHYIDGDKIATYILM